MISGVSAQRGGLSPARRNEAPPAHPLGDHPFVTLGVVLQLDAVDRRCHSAPARFEAASAETTCRGGQFFLAVATAALLVPLPAGST